MTMKSQLASLLIASQIMNAPHRMPDDIAPRSKPMPKIPLTKKQKAKRAVAKRAGQARKINHK